MAMIRKGFSVARVKWYLVGGVGDEESLVGWGREESLVER